MLYYVLVTLISLGLVLTAYFVPQTLSFLGNEVSQWCANFGLTLLRITLLVKPVLVILMKYTELKTLTFTWLRDYLKTVKWRSFKWLCFMLLSIVYFVAWWGMKRRRLLGITTFLAIFTHAGIYIAGWMGTEFTLWDQLQTRYLLMWYIGILALFLGYITSNNYSLKLFKKNRKLIQYSAYLALIFAILHLVVLNFGEYFGQLLLLLVYLVMKLIEKGKIKLP